MRGPVDTSESVEHLSLEDPDPMSPRVSDSPPAADCACHDVDRARFEGGVAKLVHAHRAQLVRVARREGLDGEDAFDAVQEAFHTFLTLPAAGSLPETGDDARKLLVAITRNLARNRRRLAAVARPHEGDTAVLDALPDGARSVEDLLAEAEDELRLRGCVDSLADVQRTVVTLRMLDDVGGEDVARALGITPGHVAVLLHRAKANLLACMTANAKP
jgi:RNA polymerase sigma-70 factor (ECF subfamily)